jgi:hypothetical protein
MSAGPALQMLREAIEDAEGNPAQRDTSTTCHAGCPIVRVSPFPIVPLPCLNCLIPDNVYGIVAPAVLR